MERDRIVAVDFDGTLCESKYPEIGKANQALIDHLIFRKKCDEKLILWTCRNGKELDDAVKWCKERGLIFDAINENLPEIVEQMGGDTRKIFADEYIDDKNMAIKLLEIPYEAMAMRTCNFSEDQTEDMLRHAVFGLCSEAGEVAGIFQKQYQGHNINVEDLKEELGDCLWMIAEACVALDISLRSVMEANIEKLWKRYPNGFDPERSLNRKSSDD